MGLRDFFKSNTAPKVEPLEIKIKDLSGTIHSFSIKYDLSKPYQSNYKSNQGFYFGQDNLFPDELANMYNASPLHSRAIQLKKLLTVGDGYDIDGISKMDGGQRIILNQLTNQFDKMYNKIALDYFLNSQIYIQVLWNADNSKIIKINRIAPEKIRIAEVNEKMEPTSYYYCYDWSQLGRFGKTKIAIFNQSDKVNKTQLYVHQVESAGQKLYSLPTYISGLNWVALDTEMSVYHKSNIQNSLNPSMLVEFFKAPASEEEKQTVLQSLNDSFAGSKNTGKVMVMFNGDVETAARVTQMEANKLDKTFLSLGDTIIRQILQAHNINPILLGLKTAGSLGDGGELELSYKIFNKSVIKPAQKDIEGILNEFISINGLSNKIQFKDADIYAVQAQITKENKPLIN